MTPKKDLVKTGAYIARDYILDLAEELVFAFSWRNYMSFPEYKDMERRRLLREDRTRLRELNRRKWIETKIIGNRVLARLTEKGWQQALRHKIRKETNLCKNGVCIVIFDIPEKERFVRNVLRAFLKEWGFQKLQHSVWMTDRDVVKPMMLLLQRRGLDKWIRIIQGSIVTASLIDPLRARVGRFSRKNKKV